MGLLKMPLCQAYLEARGRRRTLRVHVSVIERETRHENLQSDGRQTSFPSLISMQCQPALNVFEAAHNVLFSVTRCL